MQSRTIPEADWKLFRQLRPIALERFCERVLVQTAALIADASQTGHERYLALFKLIQQRDDELGLAFNDSRRTTALLQLAQIRSRDLLTDEEMSGFSPETQAVVQSFMRITPP